MAAVIVASVAATGIHAQAADAPEENSTTAGHPPAGPPAAVELVRVDPAEIMAPPP